MASQANLSSSLICGSSLQTDNFFTECKHMLGRVFFPYSTPLRVEAYIKSDRDGAGLIGTDRRMQYASRLATPEGNPIPLQERDFHIIFTVNLVKTSWVLRIIEFVLKKIFFFLQPQKQMEDPWVLPSVIFQEARENNKIRFRWNGTLYEYRLKQQNHPHRDCQANFESIFQGLQVFMENKVKSKCPYLFEEDFPPFYSFQLNKLFNEKTQIYSPAAKSLSPLTSDHLQQIMEHLPKAERCKFTLTKDEDHFTLAFDAPGVSSKNVSMLLDRRYLFILAQRKDEQAPEGRVNENSVPNYIYQGIELPEEIDPSSIDLDFRSGIGYLTYRSKASP